MAGNSPKAKCLVCKNERDKMSELGGTCENGSKSLRDYLNHLVGKDLMDEVSDNEMICGSCPSFLHGLLKMNNGVYQSIKLRNTSYVPDFGYQHKYFRRALERYDKPVTPVTMETTSPLLFMRYSKNIRSKSTCSRSKAQPREEFDEEESNIDNEEEFKCPHPDCDNPDFDHTLAMYTSHRSNMHNETPFYRCEDPRCGEDFTFFKKRHLDLHVRAVHKHTGTRDCRILCRICQRVQRNAVCLQKHLAKHEKKSYKCSMCPDLTFAEQKHYTAHKIEYHSECYIEKPEKVGEVVKKIVYKPRYPTPKTNNSKRKRYSANTMILDCHPEQLPIPLSFQQSQTILTEKYFAEIDNNKLVFSWADDVVQVPEVDEILLPRCTNVYDEVSPPESPKQRVNNVNYSGRATPVSHHYEGQEDDDDDMTEVPSNYNAGCSSYATRGYVESRNSEVAHIMGGDSDADGQDDRQMSESRNTDDPVDLVDVEHNYLVENQLHSTIPASDYNIDSISEKC